MDDGMATLLVNGTSVISGNSADIAGGGAYNFGMFTLGGQSVITNNNTARVGGGGIENQHGTVVIRGSLTGNTPDDCANC
jgi:hypothetical protein